LVLVNKFCNLPSTRSGATFSKCAKNIVRYLSNGKLVIGEAKESVRNFNDGVIQTLADFANKFNPDLVLLVCMEDDKATLEKLKSQCVDLIHSKYIRVEYSIPDERFYENSYYLPSI